MATSRLSKEAETKITNALSEVSELVNSGIRPNEAIAKTASAEGIPVGHMELMVRAFNVGRSEAQRHSGAEAHEKLAEFDLADVKSVMDIMYPSVVKSASVMSKDASVSDAYTKSPEKTKPALAPLPSLMPMIKSASAAPAVSDVARDTLGSTRNLSSLIEKIGSASDKLRTDSANTRDKVMQGISKLAGYFRTYGSKPFMVVKDNSERLFGKKASALLDIISSSNRQLKKQAGTVDDLMSPVNMDEEPYKSIKGCMELADIHLNKQASSAYLKSLAQQALVSGFGSSLPTDNNGSVLDGMDKTAARPGFTQLATAGRMQAPQAGLFKTLSDIKNYEAETPNEAKDYKFIADQRLQDMTLKNIRASAALSDLMSNDEIVSSHHPEDIAFHFNEIGKVMPESITNTAIMRPLLRQRLVGGMNAIAPADVKDMLEMENYRKPKEASFNKEAGPYGSGMIDPFKMKEEEAYRRSKIKKPMPEAKPAKAPEPKPDKSKEKPAQQGILSKLIFGSNVDKDKQKKLDEQEEIARARTRASSEEKDKIQSEKEEQANAARAERAAMTQKRMDVAMSNRARAYDERMERLQDEAIRNSAKKLPPPYYGSKD